METSYILDVLIETERSSTVRYEYDSDYSCMRCEKIQNTPFPFNYGFIPNTENGSSPLDIIVLSDISFNSHTIVEARIVGLFTINREDSNINKIIVVPSSNITSKYGDINDIGDIDSKILDCISQFWGDSVNCCFKSAKEGMLMYQKHIIDDDSDSDSDTELTVSNSIIDISDRPNNS